MSKSAKINLPNQFYIFNLGVFFYFKGKVYFFHAYNEFDKNANSNYVSVNTPIYNIGLATNGVCVFCAFTSVGALFYL